MDSRAELEHAVGVEARRQLEAALAGRGLLLTADRLAAATAAADEQGARLLGRALEAWFPGAREAGAEFDLGGERGAARLGGALAFGAAAGGVLAPDAGGDVRLLCALFNLAVGLVDAVCDGDAALGGDLLELLRERDLLAAALERPVDGRRGSPLPPPLAGDPTASFAVVVVETFLQLFHAVYPGDRRLELRGEVGGALVAATEAERRSLAGATASAARDELIEASRLTSVLPFRIVESLARGRRLPEPSAGTMLGEAMWRIDDLVDLCQDARSGSLNGVLLGAVAVGERPVPERMPAALERLFGSGAVAAAAAEAADALQRGIAVTGAAGERADHFLGFVQRYAGIDGVPPS